MKLTENILSSFKITSFKSGLKYIFVFHDVSSMQSHQFYPVYSTEIQVFEDQIDWIRNFFHVISLNEIVENNIETRTKKNYASIVFDDGFESVRSNAFPILKKKKLPFAVFVNQNAVNNNWLWCSNVFLAHKYADKMYLKKVFEHFSFTDITFEVFEKSPAELLILKKKLKSDYSIFFDEKYSSQKVYLEYKDLLFLLDQGATLGSHTANHKLLSGCDDVTLEEEISTNSVFVEGIIRRPVAHFAIPFGFHGTFDDRTMNLVKKFHKYIYSTERTYWNDNSQNPFPRIGLRNEGRRKLVYYVNLPWAVNVKRSLWKH